MILFRLIYAVPAGINAGSERKRLSDELWDIGLDIQVRLRPDRTVTALVLNRIQLIRTRLHDIWLDSEALKL